jgi:phosphoribosylamine---glycine ligase
MVVPQCRCLFYFDISIKLSLRFLTITKWNRERRQSTIENFRAVWQMRFLGIGDYNSLGDMYWRLVQRGHEVRVFVREPEAHQIFAGMLTRTQDWRADLDWIRTAGAEGIIIFEQASMGEEADELRRDGYHVVGGSAWGDRLETDRAFGQQVMREAGMQTAPTFKFDNYDHALEFVQANPGRYVYKLSDGIAASTRNYVGEMADGSDLSALLQMERKAQGIAGARVDFVLMQHVQGIEVGIGAYFDGEDFLSPACIDWEHKRFFPGDLGELTGEMGTVVSYRGSKRLFDLTLARIAPGLRAAKHCGYININTIVNDKGVWPLEFTCRFGYPGFAICDALHEDSWDVVLGRMVTRGERTIKTLRGYAVGIVLTVPPFPYEYGYAQLSKGATIFVGDDATEEDRRHLHFGEVELTDGRMITSGSLGYIMVVTGVGDDVARAQQAAYARARKVVIPNMRYRMDIGDKLMRGDLARLQELGYLD